MIDWWEIFLKICLPIKLKFLQYVNIGKFNIPDFLCDELRWKWCPSWILMHVSYKRCILVMGSPNAMKIGVHTHEMIMIITKEGYSNNIKNLILQVIIKISDDSLHS